jgi:hypothetical protein
MTQNYKSVEVWGYRQFPRHFIHVPYIIIQKNIHRAMWDLALCIVPCWGTWSLYVTCLRYLLLLNTRGNVLGYWRHRSVCNSWFIYDFTSRHYNLLLQCTRTFWRCVSERSWFLGSYPWISLDLVSGRSSVICSSVISLLCLSSLCLSSVCVLSMSLFSVSRLYVSLLCASVRFSAVPQIECLWPGKKTSSPTVSFPVAAVSKNLIA